MLLTTSGSLYSCGTNDACQLGHDRTVHSRFDRLDSVEQYNMVAAACGEAHNLALDVWGKTFSWGSVKLINIKLKVCSM